MKTADIERAHAAYLEEFRKTGGGLTTAKIIEVLGGGSATTANGFRIEWERECAGLVDLEQKLPQEVRDGLMAHLGGVYRKMLDMAAEGFAVRETGYQKRLEQCQVQSQDLAAALDAKSAELARESEAHKLLAADYRTLVETDREQRAKIARLEGENRILKKGTPAAQGDLVDAVKSFLTTNGFVPPARKAASASRQKRGGAG